MASRSVVIFTDAQTLPQLKTDVDTTALIIGKTAWR